MVNEIRYLMVLMLGILIYWRSLEYFPEFYVIYLFGAVLFAVSFSDDVPKETTKMLSVFEHMYLVTSMPEIPC